MQPNPLTCLSRNFEELIQSAAAQSTPDELEVTAGFTRWLTGLPHPFANLVIPGDLAEGEFSALLAELEEWSQAHKAPPGLVLFPNTGSVERQNWAEQRQWVLLDTMPGMWMELPEDFSTGPDLLDVDIQRVETGESLERMIAMFAEGYPVPAQVSDFFLRGIDQAGRANDGALANFLLTVDGEPAACSSVCVGDGVAGIYCVATLEKFRGRGLGTVITRAAMAYGKGKGARYALLHATPMGEPVYRKIGFREYCRIPVLGYGLNF